MSTEVTVENLESEILPFLSKSARTDLKTLAVQYIAGLTASVSGCGILSKGDNYIPAIIALTFDEDATVKKTSFDALVNLTGYSEAAQKVLSTSTEKDSKSLITWLDYVSDKTYSYTDSVCQLLTNLTRSEEGATRVYEELKNSGGSIENLVNILNTLNYNPSADFHYLAAFISNLTQLHCVRQEVMDSNRRILQKLAAFVEYESSVVRRRGAVSALRNCCFDADCHKWLLSDKVDVLPRLLLPLAGPEEFDDDDMEKLPEDLQYLPPDKQRESCPDIRQMLVEAIIQLCNTQPGREYVKEKNTYVIMRELDKWETDDGCKETILDLIDILIGDEPAPEHSTLKDIEIPPDVTEKFVKEDLERTGSS